MKSIAFFAADDAEKLLLRRKQIYDGAIPSGNSVAMLNLIRLARITGDEGLEKKAERIGKVFYSDVGRLPSGFTQFLVGVDFGGGRLFKKVIAGKPGAEDTRAMLKELRKHYMPNKVVVLRPTDVEEPEITKIAEFTKYYYATDGKATASVCVNYMCQLPTTDPGKIVEMLSDDKR